MERPATPAVKEFRAERLRVMRAVRRWSGADVSRNAVRGRYGPGRDADGAWQGGSPESRPSLLGTSRCNPACEPGGSPHAGAETFAAVRLFIDNDRWHGMPVYLRAGKALLTRSAYAVVEFKTAPGVPFRTTSAAKVAGNRLILLIAPEGGLPVPGAGHERAILSCMRGDQTPFMGTDLIEAACRVVQPIQDAWADRPPDFPNYAAGTSGPREAEELLARDGRGWVEIADHHTPGRAR
jgi:glucose-6-phosphate 1-dehydrogenase